MEKELAFELAEYAEAFSFDQTGSALSITKADIFDCLSVAAAGASWHRIEDLLELADRWGGTREASVLVYGKKYPAQIAGMINAAMIHAYDFDDTYDPALLHTGVVVVPAALAAAERAGNVSGKDFLTAVALGLDIHCRLARAATIGIVEGGWNYTTMFGIFGAAVAAGKIMQFTAEQFVNAFGMAYSHMSGNYQAVTDSAESKRLQPGFMVKAAIESAELAACGIRGIQHTFEGLYGLYHVYLHDRYDPAAAREGLGTRLAQNELGLKPWPCARPIHPPVNAALEARELFQPDPEEIEHVRIYMNRHLYVCACVPEEVRHHPRTVVDAQFSIPYSVACALTEGTLTLSDFTEERIARKNVQRLTAKVDGIVDPALEKQYHGKVCPVRIVIDMRDGTVYEHTLTQTLGSPEKPMRQRDMLAKAEGCIQFSGKQLPRELPERLQRVVYELENLPDVGEIVRIMQAEEAGEDS
ncbi:MAG: MmgE/PrpD family protein [Lachnospiraceae bacterium]|nr:MmgE/PrpD family protein [Lachnospiraceae bacterium]